MMDSIWTQSVGLPRFGRLEGDLKTDVLVIGGGLTGLLCTYMLTQAGVDVVLIEADRLLSGTSGNTTAKITAQHGLIYDKLIRTFGPEKARLYLEANEAALAQYRNLAQRIPCDFEDKDAFIYSTTQTDSIEREIAALDRLGFRAQFRENLPLPFPVKGAIRFAHQAQFNPVKFAAGIVRSLRIYEHTAARSFVGCTVRTDHGTISAHRIVVATHFPMINKHGAYFLKLYQHRSYVLALDDTPDVDGMYLDESQSGFSFRNANGLLLVGGGSHRTGKPGGGFALLRRFAQTHFPDAQETAHWAAQDCMTLDGVPYIGRYARSTPDLFVATGFNKWGMTSAMAAASVLCDLVQGKENPYAALFSPSRSMLHPQLALNALETTTSLLTPTKPRCPHMGCALKWNPQEHSWDCPCHGSRFTEDGKLIENPSTGDLP